MHLSNHRNTLLDVCICHCDCCKTELIFFSMTQMMREIGFMRIPSRSRLFLDEKNCVEFFYYFITTFCYINKLKIARNSLKGEV
jgi:hypothetical protein